MVGTIAPEQVVRPLAGHRSRDRPLEKARVRNASSFMGLRRTDHDRPVDHHGVLIHIDPTANRVDVQ